MVSFELLYGTSLTLKYGGLVMNKITNMEMSCFWQGKLYYMKQEFYMTRLEWFKYLTK